MYEPSCLCFLPALMPGKETCLCKELPQSKGSNLPALRNFPGAQQGASPWGWGGLLRREGMVAAEKTRRPESPDVAPGVPMMPPPAHQRSGSGP